LYAIELKLYSCIKPLSIDLHLSKIEVDDGNGLVYVFEYNEFISVNDSKEKYKRVFLLERNAQF
jgi:hypothetical protein